MPIERPVEHLSPSTPPEKIAEILERDACCVVDRVVPPDVMDRARAELAPWFERVPLGRDEFTGRHTRRIGGLIARSATVRELVENPLVLGSVNATLAKATNFQLHLTQIIAIGPGETAQAIHRDQWAFDFYPFPDTYPVQCNTIWAMTDFTEQNGATRVIPGSHRLADRLQFKESDTLAAEMEKGSVLFYTGGLYHGGGANRSDQIRIGINITYAVAWLRQEENQYLSVPLEIARELPESLLRLMGYAQGAYALGYIDDTRDPIEAVRPELSRTRAGFGDIGDLEAVQARLRREAAGNA
jgi:ectoine hydroxylase-related dioxygenase (phytanoyl-CoA dioxygenase family)